MSTWKPNSQQQVATPEKRAIYVESLLQKLCTDIGPHPAGTEAFLQIVEIVADEFEMSDKECDEHEGTHSKKVHAGRPFSQRLALFIAYAGGAGIILLSNLATEGEHTH